MNTIRGELLSLRNNSVTSASVQSSVNAAFGVPLRPSPVLPGLVYCGKQGAKVMLDG